MTWLFFDPMSMKYVGNFGCIVYVESATELRMMLKEYAATLKKAHVSPIIARTGLHCSILLDSVGYVGSED